MGLLNQDERQKLIDMLCQLPGIQHQHVRSSLVATLPDDLRNNIVYISASKHDIASIVDTVSSDVWLQLPDGSYPLLVVINISLNMVRGSRLESELHEQMNILKDKLGLPTVDTPSPIPRERDLPRKKGENTATDGNPPSQPDMYIQNIHAYRYAILDLSQELLKINGTELRNDSPVFTWGQSYLRDIINNLENLARESKRNRIDMPAILDGLNKALVELSSASILADAAGVQYRLKAFDRLISCRKYLNLVVSLMDF